MNLDYDFLPGDMVTVMMKDVSSGASRMTIDFRDPITHVSKAHFSQPMVALVLEANLWSCLVVTQLGVGYLNPSYLKKVA